jgi:hypothetical protein
MSEQNTKLITALVDGAEVEYTPGKMPENAQLFETDRFPEIPCSYKDRGIDPYRAALVIGKDGIAENMSVPAAVKGGKFDGKSAEGISIESSSQDFSAVIAYGGEYSIKDSSFRFVSKSDGSSVSDFTGYGAIVSAMNGSKVTMENCDILSVGVAKPAVFCDEKSDTLLKNCRCTVKGGTLYDGYINSADCTVMVAPPWVLGITGNARGTNLMGKNSSSVFVDCDMKANQWGVLSSDGGKDMQLIAIDSDLTLMGENPSEVDKKNPFYSRYGSGYGTYVIGNASEEFHGVNFRVGTYAVVLRGGTAIYKSSNGKIRAVSPATGKVVYEGEGKGRKTTIESDGFGFMAHGGGTLTVTEGTTVNSPFSTFLMKCGGVNLNVNGGAVLTPGNGVILQCMDDDDAIVGVDWQAKYELTFNTEFNEKEGWPSENGNITSKMELPPPPPMPEPAPDDMFEDSPIPPAEYYVNFNAEDVTLTGDLYNGTGYYGQKASALYVSLGKGSTLTGAISATEARHIDENGKQNTHFTSEQYYYLGHLENRPFHNGDNDVEVTLSDGSVWNVTGEGIITALTVGDGCVLNGTVTVDGAAVTPEAGKTYKGNIVVKAK